MKNWWAISGWSEYHWLPGVITINWFIELIFFYQAASLSNYLRVGINLVQMTGRILSFGSIVDFIARKNGAYFNRFVPNYQSFALFWSLIFWFFNTFTRHWFIRAILSWQNERHLIILFQNIIISTRYGICGISWSPHRHHAWPILGGNPWLFLVADDPLRFRRLHLILRFCYKLL